MTELAWSSAKRDDRGQLQNFECVAPAKSWSEGHKVSHPEPWAEEVQRKLRRLRPPLRDPRHLVLARAGEFLVGAIYLEFDWQQDGHHGAHIGLAARALTARGDRMGDELMSGAFDYITQEALQADGSHTVAISALAHQQNRRSHQMLNRAGFRRDGTDDGYFIYGALIDLR